MSFPLISNEGVAEKWQAVVRAGRIPHAIVIEGESGTGKSLLSETVAKTVLCRAEDAPCETCKDCHLVSVGTHPDLFIIQPPENRKGISVDQIRQLRMQAYQKPQMASALVFVIDRAETMNAESQNALLKILEEPPGQTVFVLECLSCAALLPTVLSRCTVFSLKTPCVADCEDYLRAHSRAKEEAITRAASLADGNIGRALSLLGRQKDGGLTELADSYRSAMEAGNIYEMLCMTAKLDKDRAKTERFFTALRLSLLSSIKRDFDEPYTVKRLFAYLDITDEVMNQLKNNGNLSLLLCAAAYRYENVTGQAR